MEKLTDLLFLDIETVSGAKSFSVLDHDWQSLWKKKAQFFVEDESEEAFGSAYEDRAGIFSEFGKIIVIGLGFFSKEGNDGQREFRMKALANENEKTLLEEFSSVVSQLNNPRLKLVAHNGKEFDFPYLSRRMVVQDLKIPEPLDNSGKKPWEVAHLDTMELWKFGDRKNFTSLDLLAKLFGIPSSKHDIDGSMVGRVYYEEQNLERIAEYCVEDVLVCAQVFLRLSGLPMLQDAEIIRR